MSYSNLSNDDRITITDFFNEVDTNKDGYISVAEITVAMTVIVNNITYDNSQEWLLNYFSAEDFNQDHLISLDELLLYNNNKKGQVAPLIVEVDGKKVIIAIGVSKDITYYSIGDSNEAQRRITSILTSGTDGIRSVDLTQLLVENKLTYRRHYSIPVWFTSIPESDWTRMSPGIPVVAKIHASRSWF